MRCLDFEILGSLCHMEMRLDRGQAVQRPINVRRSKENWSSSIPKVVTELLETKSIASCLGAVSERGRQGWWTCGVLRRRAGS